MPNTPPSSAPFFLPSRALELARPRWPVGAVGRRALRRGGRSAAGAVLRRRLAQVRLQVAPLVIWAVHVGEAPVMTRVSGQEVDPIVLPVHGRTDALINQPANLHHPSYCASFMNIGRNNDHPTRRHRWQTPSIRAL